MYIALNKAHWLLKKYILKYFLSTKCDTFKETINSVFGKMAKI